MISKIPVIINNRNLLTWPRKMINKIKQYDNVGEIIILDNGSTYEPLLEWYDTKPCTIIKTDNLGHKAPWISGLVKNLKSDYYIVTDPDLGLEDTPNDTINYLIEKIEKHKLPKIGLGLKWELTPKNSPYYKHVIDFEKNRFENSRIDDNVHLDVAIDTVFALYPKDNNYYFIGGGSIGGNYRAKHYPWYMTEEERESDKEFMYYINNASNSSSFKTFLKL